MECNPSCFSEGSKKISMKKALNLLIIYLSFMIIGLIAGTFLYSFYLNLQNFTAGNEIHFFSAAELYKAIFYVAFCLVLLICPLIACYRIRHPAGLSQTLVYIFICLLNWGIVFPSLYKLNKICDSHFLVQSQENDLTKGYFRKVGNRVYYFTKDFDFNDYGKKESQAVIIDTRGDGRIFTDDVEEDSNLDLIKKARPYKEIQIKETFSNTFFSLPVSFKILTGEQKKAFDKGLLPYISFLSLALLLCSLYALSNVFEWKLINSCIIFSGSFLILLANSVYYLPVLLSLKRTLTNNVLIKSLENIIDDPLIFVLNILFSFIFLLIGIIRFFVHLHAKKVR